MMEPKGIVGACECSRKWISVDKQLPDPDVEVLCWDQYCGMVIGTFNENGFEFCEFTGVTHWMPLPQPPKKED